MALRNDVIFRPGRKPKTRTRAILRMSTTNTDRKGRTVRKGILRLKIKVQENNPRKRRGSRHV